jgi:hypothetical protein
MPNYVSQKVRYGAVDDYLYQPVGGSPTASIPAVALLTDTISTGQTSWYLPSGTTIVVPANGYYRYDVCIDVKDYAQTSGGGGGYGSMVMGVYDTNVATTWSDFLPNTYAKTEFTEPDVITSTPTTDEIFIYRSGTIGQTLTAGQSIGFGYFVSLTGVTFDPSSNVSFVLTYLGNTTMA